jgi:hypothetical protein
MQDVLGSKGFRLPELYQRLVRETCQQDFDKTELYWDETSLEYVRSAGKADPDVRAIRGPTSYRSEYLDRLAKKVSAVESPTKVRLLIHASVVFKRDDTKIAPSRSDLLIA